LQIDPDHFDADPDPAYRLIVYPDPRRSILGGGGGSNIDVD
jgi:hypothetical protein